MKKNIIYSIIALLIIVGALALSGYLIANKEQPKQKQNLDTRVYLKTKDVKYAELTTSMEYRGRVSSYNNVSIAPVVSGRLLKGDVELKEGTSFKKGDILFHVNDDDVKASYIASKCSYLNVLSQCLPDIKFDFPDEYKKWNNFFNSIDIEKELPLLPKINSNKEKIYLASNDVLTNYYSLKKSEITLSKYFVRAPFDGSIVTVNKEIGDVISMNSTVASIIRTDIHEITVPVIVEDVKWININDQAEVSYNGYKTIAKVDRKSRAVDEATQSVNIYLILKGKGNLLQGQYVDVTFSDKRIKGLEIPREALITGNKVYQLKDGKLIANIVNLVKKLDDSYIINGLDTSLVVVSESISEINPETKYYSLKDAAKINAEDNATKQGMVNSGNTSSKTE